MLRANADEFAGDRIKNPDEYILTFSLMNQRDTHEMQMNEGDILSVRFAIVRGRADLLIGQEGEKPVYRGNAIADGEFDLVIPKTGTYQIELTAKRAQGSLSVIAERNAQE